MPHGDIDELFHAAARCSSPADLDAIRNKMKHISTTFAALLREFRASLPAQERKRGLPPPGCAPPRSDWRPVHDTFEGGEVGHAECPLLGQRELHPMGFFTLGDWLEHPVTGYDDRPAAVATMIVHGKTHAVRSLIDGGVDLTDRFYTVPCHVGGGLSAFIESNIEAYMWLNQMLLLGDVPCEIVRRTDGVPHGLPAELADGLSERDPKTSRQLAALRALHELTDAYDNRQYRNAKHVSDLRTRLADRTLSADELRAYLKERVFPELCRASHLLLYNELARGGRSRRQGAASARRTSGDRGGGKSTAGVVPTLPMWASPLEDPAALDAPCMQVEAVVYRTLAAVLRQVLPPMEGVKRATALDADT